MKCRRLVARKVEPLPAVSVEFDHVVAEGITGTVFRLVGTLRHWLDRAAASE